MAVQGDGKSVVVGSSNFGGSHTSDFAPARYHPNSSLDTSFAGDGRQTTDFGGSNGANGVAIQGGGKLQPLRLRRVGLLVIAAARLATLGRVPLLGVPPRGR